jgi:hypothetical protein
VLRSLRETKEGSRKVRKEELSTQRGFQTDSKS